MTTFFVYNQFLTTASGSWLFGSVVKSIGSLTMESAVQIMPEVECVMNNKYIW